MKILKSSIPTITALFLLTLILCPFAAAQNIGSFTDPRDGKTYRTVKIGEQVWMGENLNIETPNSWCYGEGGSVVTGWDEETYEPITKTLSAAEIQSNCNKYGRLYDWNTATKACPAGWHLPDTSEWGKLVTFAGGERKAGKRLKSKSPDWNGTDKFKFSALPGGFREYADGRFRNIGLMGDWWTATERSEFDGRDRYVSLDMEIYTDRVSVRTDDTDKSFGYSVRCLRD